MTRARQAAVRRVRSPRSYEAMPGPLAPKTGALECQAIANEALLCRATRLQNEPCTSCEGIAHATHCSVGKGSRAKSRRLKWSSGHTIQLSIRIEPQPVTNVPSYVQRALE